MRTLGCSKIGGRPPRTWDGWSWEGGVTPILLHPRVQSKQCTFHFTDPPLWGRISNNRPHKIIPEQLLIIVLNSGLKIRLKARNSTTINTKYSVWVYCTHGTDSYAHQYWSLDYIILDYTRRARVGPKGLLCRGAPWVPLRDRVTLEHDNSKLIKLSSFSHYNEMDLFLDTFSSA